MCNCQFVSLLVNKSVIKSFEWKKDVSEIRLAIVSKNSRFLYFWTPEGAEVTVVPASSKRFLTPEFDPILLKYVLDRLFIVAPERFCIGVTSE